MQFLCPCCSGALYEVCCKPFYEGKAPENALFLMRSRYSAYALNLPDYIIKTTHLQSPYYEKNQCAWRESIIHFSTGTRFDKLEIVDFKEEGLFASVTFIAYLTQGERDATFREKSTFEKVDGSWLYLQAHLHDRS